MGMFTDLHKLDQEERTEAAPPPRSQSPARPHANTSSAKDRLHPQGAAPQADAAPERPGLPPTAAGPVRDAPVQIDQPATPAMDLTDIPYRKDTFLFTDAEFEALDDLKLRMRRTLDVRVTKNDLARCAIAYLVEDCRRSGGESPVILPLKRKGGR